MSEIIDNLRAGGGLPPLSSQAQAQLDKFGFVRVDGDLVAPTRSWLVDGLWPERGIGFIIGPPKVGKSWMSIDLAICLAVGVPFLGREVRPQGRVLYFLGEDDLSDTLVRIDLLLAGRGLTRAALEGSLYFSEVPPTMDDPVTRGSVVELIKAVRPTLVVIDPLARFLSDADENSATEMRPVINWFRQDVSRGCETAIAIVHHTDKGGRSARGTGDFRALYEVRLRLGERKRDRAVPVDVEMRGAKQPEPFSMTLLETENRGMLLECSGAEAADGDLNRRARALLLKVGAAGVTTEAARKALGIRWDSGKAALRAAGGINTGSRSGWVLAEFLPNSPSGPEVAPSDSPGLPKSQQAEAHPDRGEAREDTAASVDSNPTLASSHAPEDSGSPVSLPSPSQGGLMKTPREEVGEGETGSASPEIAA